MIKRIHVNQHNIKANRKAGNRDKPVFTVKTYNSNTTGWVVTIAGPSQVIYSPDKPLKCGAVAWIETESLVAIDGEFVG